MTKSVLVPNEYVQALLSNCDDMFSIQTVLFENIETLRPDIRFFRDFNPKAQKNMANLKAIPDSAFAVAKKSINGNVIFMADFNSLTQEQFRRTAQYWSSFQQYGIHPNKLPSQQMAIVINRTLYPLVYTRLLIEGQINQ